jgi:hypothetical protein
LYFVEGRIKMSKERPFYNGVPSKAGDIFIRNVEARLGRYFYKNRRPWDPWEEASVMRAFNATLREVFGYDEFEVQ